VTAKKLATPTIATTSEIKKWGLRRSYRDPREGLFNTTEEFYNCLDKIADTQADWIEATIIDPENGRTPVKYYRRDTLAVLAEILSTPVLKDKCVWTPVKMYDGSGNRVYTDIHTGDWMWTQQVICLTHSLLILEMHLRSQPFTKR
jgi:Plavaka transposase